MYIYFYINYDKVCMYCIFHFNLINCLTVIETPEVTVFMTKTFNVPVNRFILYTVRLNKTGSTQTKRIYLQHNLQYWQSRDNHHELGSLKPINISQVGIVCIPIVLNLQPLQMINNAVRVLNYYALQINCRCRALEKIVRKAKVSANWQRWLYAAAISICENISNTGY